MLLLVWGKIQFKKTQSKNEFWPPFTWGQLVLGYKALANTVFGIVSSRPPENRMQRVYDVLTRFSVIFSSCSVAFWWCCPHQSSFSSSYHIDKTITQTLTQSIRRIAGVQFRRAYLILSVLYHWCCISISFALCNCVVFSFSYNW